MSITDQQFETIILRLESGESMRSIQADFPHLEADIAALQDLQDFFAAQRLRAKPDPQGLKSVLRQVDLLRSEAQDDERSWGHFFTPWMRYAGVAVPALLVVAVSGYLWQPPLPETTQTVLSESERQSAAPMMAQAGMVAIPAVASVALESSSAVPASMDMKALVESLSSEFASDMAEFETARDDLEPLFSEQLFSYDNTSTL